MIDIARLGLYSRSILADTAQANAVLVGSALVAAFAGAWLGNRYLRKVTIGFDSSRCCGVAFRRCRKADQRRALEAMFAMIEHWSGVIVAGTFTLRRAEGSCPRQIKPRPCAPRMFPIEPWVCAVSDNI